MNNKNKILAIFMISVSIVSIYFITSITFATGTYVEMFPAFKGTVCLLQDNVCVQGTDKTIDFAFAQVWESREMKLAREQWLRENPTTSPEGKLAMLTFDNKRYRATQGGYFVGESLGDVTNVSNKNLVLKALNNYDLLGVYDQDDTLSVEINTFVGKGTMSILNADGSEILEAMQIVLVSDNAGRPEEFRGLGIIINGQKYLLTSIDNQITEPITYTFSG